MTTVWSQILTPDAVLEANVAIEEAAPELGMIFSESVPFGSFLSFATYCFTSCRLVQISQIATTLIVKGTVTAQYSQKLGLTCSLFRMWNENIGVEKSDYAVASVSISTRTFRDA